MATISLNAALYDKAQIYAHGQNMSVDEWIASLILRFVPAKQEKYRMKKVEELSPEVQQLIGFAKPAAGTEEDINGDLARDEYLSKRYAI